MSAETSITKANDWGASPLLRRCQTLGHLVATTFVVLVLLSAAGLKIHSLLASSADAHRSLPLVIAAGEILLSILLLVKFTRKLGWVVAGCLFASFAAFNTYQTLQGVAECGCFGAIQIDPRTALLIDLSALTLILGFPPRTTGGVFSQIFKIMPPVSVGAAVLTVICCVALGAHWISTPSIVLIPDELLGKEFSFANEIDAPVDLTRGHWRLVFLRRDCPVCQLLLEKEHVFLDESTPVLLLGMRFLPGSEYRSTVGSPRVFLGSVSTKIRWQKPLLLELKDGLVCRVSTY